MKTFKLHTILLALLGGFACTARCATNGVVLGQNFQSVIDASSPGDTLIVQPGAYPDASLVFNKPLTVLPSGTNGSPIQFMGTIQVTGAGAGSFQQVYFATNVQTVGSTVAFIDTFFNGNVSVAGGKVTMKRTILNYPLTLTNNAALEALRMTNNATVTGVATAGSGVPFLAVQSWFLNSVTLSGYKVWLGYNYFTNIGLACYLGETNCDSVLIGNKFFLTTVPSSSANIIYESSGTFKAYNNLISASDTGSGGNGPGCWLISLNSTASEIVNNTIRGGPGGYGGAYLPYRGIEANGTGPITLRGNIISLSFGNPNAAADVEGAGAASQTLFVSYCDLWNFVNSIAGTLLLGVTPPQVNCLLQVNPNLAADGSLNAGSPCINAGPPDAIYNNPDGTRNTMGYTGGPYWNPANYTNNNPMVFLLTGQQTAIKSIQTSIPVNVGASAGN